MDVGVGVFMSDQDPGAQGQREERRSSKQPDEGRCSRRDGDAVKDSEDIGGKEEIPWNYGRNSTDDELRSHELRVLLQQVDMEAQGREAG
jgi:hypothetical protein